MNPVAKTFFDYLRDVIYNPLRASLNIEELPEDFAYFGRGLQYYTKCVAETMELTKALAEGNLDVSLPSAKNELAAPFKSLHASLKHLTWQTQQVAKGDYQQRVEFMGDFSKAFNSMVEQLEKQRIAVLEELEHSHRATQNLTRSNNLFKIITREISQWIIMIDKESKETLFESRPADNILADACFTPQLFNWLIKTSDEVADNSEPITKELVLSNDGLTQHFSATIYPLFWYGHNTAAFMLTDVSAEKKRIQDLERVAYRDMLTKVFNRHYGMNLLNEWLNEKKAFLICFVDIDNLKYVNDKFGHGEGDKYILMVTRILKSFSPKAVVCRLGGDEFMLLAQNWQKDAGEEKIEDLRDILKSYDNEPESRYNHSISYGIVEVEESNTRSAKELLSDADEKMYNYKRKHKAQRDSDGAV